MLIYIHLTCPVTDFVDLNISFSKKKILKNICIRYNQVLLTRINKARIITILTTILFFQSNIQFWLEIIFVLLVRCRFFVCQLRWFSFSVNFKSAPILTRRLFQIGIWAKHLFDSTWTCNLMRIAKKSNPNSLKTDQVTRSNYFCSCSLQGSQLMQVFQANAWIKYDYGTRKMILFECHIVRIWKIAVAPIRRFYSRQQILTFEHGSLSVCVPVWCDFSRILKMLGIRDIWQ